MKHFLAGITLLSTLFIIAYSVITVYDTSLSVGRMWETPGVRPHEIPIPVMDKGVVAIQGGDALVRAQLAANMEPPTTDISGNPIEQGETAYNNFCVHCHGKRLDGLGTVGQSFYPLPRDLKSPRVLEQKDKDLFQVISYGKERMPALASTVSIEDRIAVTRFIRKGM